tara:strand:+ start:2123 stop:3295 length:1173 start_codon:yes stop_codon:yes gene_type:complete
MKDIDSTKLFVNKILKNYSLCDFCLARFISKRLDLKPSNNLGKKFNKNRKKPLSTKCFVCKNIFEKLDDMVDHMIENSTSYQFSSFLIGSVLKPSITDNDDVIKSRFKIKGVMNIKSQINHELSKKFSRKTKSKMNILEPDLTIKTNFKDDSCMIYSRALFVYGRYTKTKRNIQQKRKPCEHCTGKGCISCNYHGLSNFNSVEGQIAKFLIKKFNSKQIKINWIGGEDKLSLISGNGRPFFAKIIDPHIKKIRITKQNNLDGIELHDLRQIQNQPKDSVPFRSKVIISVESEDPINNKLLKKFSSSKNIPLEIINNNQKITKKTIYNIKYKKLNSNSLEISMLVDSGVPIKSFIERSNVKPNLSELLENRCNCVQFDFKQIDVMSNTYKN